jgi:hypothetical protein
MWLVAVCTVSGIGNFIVCGLICIYDYSYCIVCCYVVGDCMYSDLCREFYCVYVELCA